MGIEFRIKQVAKDTFTVQRLYKVKKWYKKESRWIWYDCDIYGNDWWRRETAPTPDRAIFKTLEKAREFIIDRQERIDFKTIYHEL